jgi:hypothetical protein
MRIHPTLKKFPLKDMYSKIQNNEITEYQFRIWLTAYAHKHWNIGMDDAEKLEISNLTK